MIAFALRHWRILAAAAAILIIAIAVKAWAHSLYDRGYEAAQADARAELERARELWRQIDSETQDAHAKEIAKLRADAARELRGRPIRCMLDSPSEVRAGRDPGEPAGGPGGEPALRAAPDLRPIIVQRGEACEELRQQLIQIRERQERRRGQAD